MMENCSEIFNWTCPWLLIFSGKNGIFVMQWAKSPCCGKVVIPFKVEKKKFESTFYHQKWWSFNSQISSEEIVAAFFPRCCHVCVDALLTFSINNVSFRPNTMDQLNKICVPSFVIINCVLGTWKRIFRYFDAEFWWAARDFFSLRLFIVATIRENTKNNGTWNWFAGKTRVEVHLLWRDPSLIWRVICSSLPKVEGSGTMSAL